MCEQIKFILNILQFLIINTLTAQSITPLLKINCACLVKGEFNELTKMFYVKINCCCIGVHPRMNKAKQ